MSGAGSRASGGGGSRRITKLRLSGGDLISLDSPRAPCPTGLLVDLTTETVQAPYPKELLSVGEFDDTFGIFAYPSSSATSSTATAIVTPRTKRDSFNLEDQPTKLFSIDESPGSLTQRLQPIPPTLNQTSPLPTRRSLGSLQQNQHTPHGALSDTESLLDLADLPEFSFSDSEDVFEELRKNDESWGISPSTMAREIEEIVKAERAITSTSSMAIEEPMPMSMSMPMRRDSLSSKLQRLNSLLNSPIPSPPKPRLSIASQPLSQGSMLPPTSANRPTMRMSTSTMTMTSPIKKDKIGSMFVAPEAKTPASKVHRVPHSAYTPTSSQRTPIYDGAVSPADSVDETSAFKRLSFSSISSTSSPTKSLKNEPMFGIRKANFGTRGGMPSSRPLTSSIKAAGQRIGIGGRSAIKPLKATVPIPIAGYSSGNMTITSNVSSNNEHGRVRTRSSGCASAPVTRKFIPPIAASSPHPVAPGTPSRTNRMSFNNIRSSGYGQQSPSAHKISAPSPIAEYIPTPTPASLPSPKPMVRQVMGAKGQLPQKDRNSLSVKPVKVETGGTGIRRSISLSKENKPKLNSFLPRPGFTRPNN